MPPGEFDQAQLHQTRVLSNLCLDVVKVECEGVVARVAFCTLLVNDDLNNDTQLFSALLLCGLVSALVTSSAAGVCITCLLVVFRYVAGTEKLLGCARRLVTKGNCGRSVGEANTWKLAH